MAVHHTHLREGLEPGWNWATRIDDDEGAHIELGLLVLRPGEAYEEASPGECAWLIMTGSARVRCDAGTAVWRRRSLFDEAPHLVHLPEGARVRFSSDDGAELARVRVANASPFEPRLLAPAQVRSEVRGAGCVDDAARRLVRTAIDDASASPHAKLVLGEVVHLPGRWSSYPPHHHVQPEVYHYRFAPEHGYGHAELGDTVVKVRQRDTVTILPNLDHAQVAAPGYAMYYIWAIRHLDGARYREPEFTAEHAWTMEAGARVWAPDWR